MVLGTTVIPTTSLKYDACQPILDMVTRDTVFLSVDACVVLDDCIFCVDAEKQCSGIVCSVDDFPDTSYSSCSVPYGSVYFFLGSPHNDIDLPIFPQSKFCFGSVWSVTDIHSSPFSSGYSSPCMMVADYGATSDMEVYFIRFLSYTATPSGYVEVSNGRRIPCLSTGMSLYIIRDHVVDIHGVFHVPSLLKYLFSFFIHHRRPNCGFIDWYSCVLL